MEAVNKAYMKRNAKVFAPHRLKNLIVGVAHWQSWKAQDKKNLCQCCGKKNSPSCDITDKRAKRVKSPKEWGEIYAARMVCQSCIKNIEEFLGVEFKRSYAP